MATSEHNRFTFKLFVILLLTTFCLGVSFFQMAKGYAEVGGYVISSIISFVIVLILFFLSLEIHRAKKRGESYIRPLLAYLFFAAVSFAGNYNGFYGRSLGEEIVNNEVEQKIQKLDELYSTAEVAFKERKGITPQVEAFVSDLNKQIVNEANGGCGKRCLDILQKISNLLGRKITDQGFQDKDRTKLFENYKRTIYGEDEMIFLDKFKSEITSLKAARDELLTKKNTILDPLKPTSGQRETETSDSESQMNKKLNLINQMVNLYKERGLEAQAKIGNSKKLIETQLKAENVDIGKLKHTLDSALSNLNRPVIWAIGALALMIDLFVPLFIIFITKKEGEKNRFVEQKGIEILESY